MGARGRRAIAARLALAPPSSPRQKEDISRRCALKATGVVKAAEGAAGAWLPRASAPCAWRRRRRRTYPRLRGRRHSAKGNALRSQHLRTRHRGAADYWARAATLFGRGSYPHSQMFTRFAAAAAWHARRLAAGGSAFERGRWKTAARVAHLGTSLRALTLAAARGITSPLRQRRRQPRRRLLLHL